MNNNQDIKNVQRVLEIFENSKNDFTDLKIDYGLKLSELNKLKNICSDFTNKDLIVGNFCKLTINCESQ